MPSNNPYREDKQSRPAEEYTGIPGVDEAVNEIVQAGAEIGSGLLDGLAGVVRSVGDALNSRSLDNKDVPFPPGSAGWTAS